VPQGVHPEKPHRLCHPSLDASQGSGPPDRKHRLSDQARHDRAVENPISQDGSCVSPICNINEPRIFYRNINLLFHRGIAEEPGIGRTLHRNLKKNKESYVDIFFFC
jgi:hypothetical protein